jgi:GT2 family glycosyltransferase
VRALTRFPADIDEAPVFARANRLFEIAEDPAVEWILVVDTDAILAPDAFGAFRRAAGPRTAIVGGRALVGSMQRLGAMFGPARSGPNPFELAPVMGMQADRGFAEIVRGPIDAPERGAYAVSAAFVRSLSGVPLDPVALHLDLAVHARAAGREVVCEPSLSFGCSEDPLELRRALGNLRRFASAGSWDPEELHREPPRIRSAFISREVRVMGNIRGYERRPYPRLDVLVPVTDELARARVQRAGTALAAGGTYTACTPGDADLLRRSLARTGERYLLVAETNVVPDRAAVEVLAERLERSGRVAIALERTRAPYGAALFHCGRIVRPDAFRGDDVASLVADAIERLPERRLFASTPAGQIVPARLPPAPGLQRLDIVFVAASKPAATLQTLQALMAESVDGTITAVYPAGGTTTERLFAAYAGVRLMPDGSDVQLAVGLNRALGAGSSDGVAIVRDDVQVPHGFFARLMDAFRRIPRLGVAVPRLGGADRPESLPDLGYRNSAEMQALYDRRAEAFAREANLLDVATAPVLIVSREVLDIVGGFDEAFGFSRLGVEDFTRRVRAANFLIACCDDAYAHLFPPEEAASFVGNLDAAPFLRDAYQKRWSTRNGFDPATDRVPLRFDVPAAGAPAPAPNRTVVRVLLPLGSVDDWAIARPLLTELAAAFRVSDPVEVAVGLDGTFGLQNALSELREILLATGVPMEETLSVSIDFVPSVEEWRDAGTGNVRVAGLERDALAELPAVDGAAALRAHLAVTAS